MKLLNPSSFVQDVEHVFIVGVAGAVPHYTDFDQVKIHSDTLKILILKLRILGLRSYRIQLLDDSYCHKSKLVWISDTQ